MPASAAMGGDATPAATAPAGGLPLVLRVEGRFITLLLPVRLITLLRDLSGAVRVTRSGNEWM